MGWKNKIVARLSSRGLSPARARGLRAHLALCDECRGLYSRRTALLRAAVTGDPHAPLAIESQRLMEETLGMLGLPAAPANAVARLWRVFPAPVPGTWPSLRTLAPRTAVVAASLAIVVAAAWLATDFFGERSGPGEQAGAESVQVRGDTARMPAVGLGISGVDAQGREYEIVKSEGVCLPDALKFYVTARDARLRHYFVFGVQAGKLLWYFPDPEEKISLRIPEGQTMPYMVPWEIVLGPRHELGPARVVAVFTRKSLPLNAVEAALAGLAAAGVLEQDGQDATAALIRKRLGGGGEVAVLGYNIIGCGGGL